MAVVFLIVGVLIGAVAVAFYTRPSLHSLREQIARERTGAEERVALVQELNADWEDRFREMSSAALAQNNDSFLTLAEEKLPPLTTTLSNFEQQTQALEKSRQDAYNRLSNQVVSLVSLQEQLRAETRSLSTALRAPATRGRWGEMQLRRTVEAAGMLEYCDFVEQSSARDGDGRLLRPDLVVKLPGGRQVVVDAKTPMQGLLDALDETLDDAGRRARMDDFVRPAPREGPPAAAGRRGGRDACARHVRDHVSKLNAKSYWQQFSPTPDFVVM